MSDLPKLLAIAFLLATLMTLFQHPVDADSNVKGCSNSVQVNSGERC